MALPCILFPSALTNSISLLLIPAVAQKQAESSSKETFLLIKKAAGGCFSLGLLCSVFFLLTGSFLGNFLFHSTLAGNFIVTLAWICPFLYTSSALLSAINGLGLTTLTLMINLLGLSIRILSVYFRNPALWNRRIPMGTFHQSINCLPRCITHTFPRNQKRIFTIF